MKKYMAIFLIFLIVLMMAACASKKTVPTFEEAKNFTEEDFKLQMEGIHVNEVTAVWGKPDVQLSGFWGDSWFMEEAGRFVTLYYDSNGKVETVKLSEQEDALEEDEFEETAVEEETPVDLIPMVMVDGKLYLDTGKASTADVRCGVMDGEITSSVSSNRKPTKNNQSNFGSGYPYQYGPREGCIEVCLDEGWFIFATEDVKEEMNTEEEPFRLLCNGEEQKPYIHYLSSKQWGGEGWLCGDGKNLEDNLSVVEKELTVLTFEEDLELELGENAELIQIAVLDTDLEAVVAGEDLSLLSELPVGNYYLTFLVTERGQYISEGQDYEMNTNQYIYKLTK